MPIPSTPPPTHELRHDEPLSRRIQHCRRVIHILEVEHAVAQDIIIFAKARTVENKLSNDQRNPLLAKYEIDLQIIERQLQTQKQRLHRIQHERAYPYVVAPDTHRLTAITQQINALQSTISTSPTTYTHLLDQLENLHSQVRKLANS